MPACRARPVISRSTRFLSHGGLCRHPRAEGHAQGAHGRESRQHDLSELFLDGRAASLEEQALGPIQNPIEMGNTHHAMVETLSKIGGYTPYFAEAFGTPEITKERVAQGDCRLRAHPHERQFTVGSLAAEEGRERGLC
jgi:hypothetical protein